MKTTLQLTLIAATLAALSTTSFAQAPAPDATPRVDQREANQAQRIEQGKASGELAPREAHKLNREQKVIAKAESNAKADGTVTPAERKKLHKMQNHASRDIKRQKHDANTAIPGPGK